MDSKIFEEIGFTGRETKVYLALLELGLTTTGPITAKTRLQSAKVYETLEKLRERGLVSFVIKSKTKYFQAADPKEILNLIEDRKRRLKEVVTELELKQKHSFSKQTAIVHEGFKAFKALFNRIADEAKKEDVYRAFAFKSEYNSEDASIFLGNFHKKLEEKKVVDRVLGAIEVKKQIKNNFKENKNIKIKFTKNQTPLGVSIIKGRVINLIWGDRPTAIEIISDQIYEQYENFFDELWKSAKA